MSALTDCSSNIRLPEFVRFIDWASYICISLIAVASLDISIGDAGQHPPSEPGGGGKELMGKVKR